MVTKCLTWWIHVTDSGDAFAVVVDEMAAAVWPTEAKGVDMEPMAPPPPQVAADLLMDARLEGDLPHLVALLSTACAGPQAAPAAWTATRSPVGDVMPSAPSPLSSCGEDAERGRRKRTAGALAGTDGAAAGPRGRNAPRRADALAAAARVAESAAAAAADEDGTGTDGDDDQDADESRDNPTGRRMRRNRLSGASAQRAWPQRVTHYRDLLLRAVVRGRCSGPAPRAKARDDRRAFGKRRGAGGGARLRARRRTRRTRRVHLRRRRAPDPHPARGGSRVRAGG